MELHKQQYFVLEAQQNIEFTEFHERGGSPVIVPIFLMYALLRMILIRMYRFLKVFG